MMTSPRPQILRSLILGHGRNSRAYATKTKRVTYSELQKKTACDRALDHFDDFYGTFYGKKKWPQLRLGLLSPPKYVAIPNPFTGSLDRVASHLSELGAYNLHTIWEQGRDELVAERKLVDVKKDLGRIHALEKTLESIAVTKRAEEMEVLYQNAPHKRGTVGETMWGTETSSSSTTTTNVNNYDGSSSRVLSHPSQAAFVPPTKLKGMDEFAFDSEYYAGFLPQNLHSLLDPNDDHPFVYSDPGKTERIQWPPPLNPFTFELGSGAEFPSARRDPGSGLREYICVNGASIAPVLALDLNPSVDLLDVCSGPGTKSLMALMTMALGSITCNDLDTSRLYRVKKIFEEFTGTQYPDLVNFTKFNGKGYPGGKKFDRVLVDVPCLNDRVSCSIPENNIFKTTRTKERLNLVNVQKAILLSSLKTMKKAEGSVTVYSTCTLSPVENDGVMMHTLKETDVENLAVDLFGLLSLLKPFEHRGFFRMTRTRFGVMIEPNIVSNFGPMFISRIIVQNQTPIAASESDPVVEEVTEEQESASSIQDQDPSENQGQTPSDDKHSK